MENLTTFVTKQLGYGCFVYCIVGESYVFHWITCGLCLAIAQSKTQASHRSSLKCFTRKSIKEYIYIYIYIYIGSLIDLLQPSKIE